MLKATGPAAFAALIGAAVIAAVIMHSRLLPFPTPPQPRDPRREERSDLDSGTTFRLHILPNSLDADPSRLNYQAVQALVREDFSLGSDLQICIKSLAANPLRNGLVATLNFPKIPERLLRTPSQQHVFQGDGSSQEFLLELDVDFHGLTPLHSQDTAHEDLDIIALSGLNAHAFGSFKHKGGPFMWLQDDLPLSMPTCRIFIYGYDTKLFDSDSFQSLEDLGFAFKSSLVSLYKANLENGNLKPLVLIGHSLGGLVLKEALCKLSVGETANDRAVLKSVHGVLFFGTPNQGMDIRSLIPMAEGNANEDFLRSLGHDSPDLRRQAEQWSRRLDSINDSAASRSLRIISYYETVESPTAILVGGQWKMSGPKARLVDRSSATHGRSWEINERYVHPINRDHSELVKFHGRNDPIYTSHVLPQLQDFLRISEHQKKEVILTDEDKACLSSLGFPEQHYRFDQIAEGAKNTCLWLRRHRQYKEWYREWRGLLRLEGHPGSGKSTLMKHAVEDMTNKLDHCSLVMKFFFHARGIELQRTFRGFLRSLAHQLLNQFPESLDKATPKYLEMEKHPTWQTEWLKAFLKKELPVACEKQPIVIFVDALDECDSQDMNDVADFLTEILSSNSVIRLKIFASCRHYPSLFTGGSRLVVEENNNSDIAKFIKSKLSALPDPKRIQIGNDIVTHSGGIFQWAQLVCQKMLQLHKKGYPTLAMQGEIQSTPKELHELYRTLFKEMDLKDLQLTWRLFQWVCFALRPLTICELQYAIMLSLDMQHTTVAEIEQQDHFRHELNDMLNAILDLSRGLIEILHPLASDHGSFGSFWSSKPGTRGSRSSASMSVAVSSSSLASLSDYEHTWESTTQLIHQTVMDYLLETGFKELEDRLKSTPTGHIDATPIGRGHWFISRSGFRVIELLDTDHRVPKSSLPLLRYIMEYFYPHIAKVEKESIDQADVIRILGWPYVKSAFYESTKHKGQALPLLEIYAGERLLKGHYFDADEKFEPPAYTTLLHISAILGLRSVARSIVNKEFPMVDGAPASNNPFCLTFSHPYHPRMRQEMLIDGRWNTNIVETDHDGTALHLAARHRQTAVAHEIMLSPNTNPNVLDKRDGTPLHVASRSNQVDMVREILQSPTTNPNVEDKQGRTPLHVAIMCDQVAAAHELVQSPYADLNAQEMMGQAPLHLVVARMRRQRRAWEGLFQALLQHPQINPNLQDRDGASPIFLSVRHDDTEVLQQLLRKDNVIANARDGRGNTALFEAFIYSNVDALELLLESGKFSDDDIRHTFTVLKQYEPKRDSSSIWDPVPEPKIKRRCMQILLETGVLEGEELGEDVEDEEDEKIDDGEDKPQILDLLRRSEV